MLQRIAPPKTGVLFFSTPLFRTALPLPRMHTGALKRANIGIISLFTKAISLIYKLLHEIAFFHHLQLFSIPSKKKKCQCSTALTFFAGHYAKTHQRIAPPTASRLLCDRPVHSFTMPEACLAGIPHFRRYADREVAAIRRHFSRSHIRLLDARYPYGSPLLRLTQVSTRARHPRKGVRNPVLPLDRTGSGFLVNGSGGVFIHGRLLSIDPRIAPKDYFLGVLPRIAPKDYFLGVLPRIAPLDHLLGSAPWIPPPESAPCYQLAFLTPGIRPCEAISRNWIRLMPNWRM